MDPLPPTTQCKFGWFFSLKSIEIFLQILLTQGLKTQLAHVTS